MGYELEFGKGGDHVDISYRHGVAQTLFSSDKAFPEHKHFFACYPALHHHQIPRRPISPQNYYQTILILPICGVVSQ